MTAKLTKAARRELSALLDGRDADGDVLERAGLVECFSEIRVAGRHLSRVDLWRLTDSGRSALEAKETGDA